MEMLDELRGERDRLEQALAVLTGLTGGGVTKRKGRATASTKSKRKKKRRAAVKKGSKVRKVRG